MFDVEFIPVPERVLVEMLRLAEVCREDVVYDLGCGEGRIVTTVARECGARAVGVDLDADLLSRARQAVHSAGLEQRIELRQQNLFETELQAASVITLYLLDSLNVRLRPRILAQCRPGTRVVSYSFRMGEWEPDAHTPIAANGVSLWIVPANLSGSWKPASSAADSGLALLEVQQKFQRISGRILFRGHACDIEGGRVRGQDFEFGLCTPESPEPRRFRGRLEDDTFVIDGEILWRGVREPGSRREIAE